MENEKFICVDDSDFEGYCTVCDNQHFIKNPKLNEIVTLNSCEKVFGKYWFVFKEYKPYPCGYYPGYRTHCFRPLDEYLKQYSLEEVEEILNPVIVNV